MKFIAAVVMIAYFGLARAGQLAFAAPTLLAGDGTYTSIPAPKLLATSLPYAAAPLPYFAAAPAFRSYGFAAPFAAPIAAPLAYSAPLATIAAIPGEARYTAINRGSFHDAPLPGHALSQSSINLAPAPGTF